MKVIEDKDRTLLKNFDEIITRWKEYCEELYNHDVQTKSSQHQYDKEPPIIKDEVITVIRTLKNNKSPGTENIAAEPVKAGGAPVVDILSKINNMILEYGEWPDR